MCFGGGGAPHDDSAEIARADEAARQQKILAGQTSIDEAFKPFDDSYFGGVSKSYTDYYNPQIDEQFNKALQKKTLDLANSGNLSSSSGATQIADLRREYDRQRTSLADQGLQAANDLRGKVESNKSELYQSNRSAADPASAASQAAARAGNLQAPLTFSPLGDVFSSILSKSGQALGLEAAGYPGVKTGFFASNPTTGTGSSSRVVS